MNANRSLGLLVRWPLAAAYVMFSADTRVCRRWVENEIILELMFGLSPRLPSLFFLNGFLSGIKSTCTWCWRWIRRMSVAFRWAMIWDVVFHAPPIAMPLHNNIHWFLISPHQPWLTFDSMADISFGKYWMVSLELLPKWRVKTLTHRIAGGDRVAMPRPKWEMLGDNQTNRLLLIVISASLIGYDGIPLRFIGPIAIHRNTHGVLSTSDDASITWRTLQPMRSFVKKLISHSDSQRSDLTLSQQTAKTLGCDERYANSGPVFGCWCLLLLSSANTAGAWMSNKLPNSMSVSVSRTTIAILHTRHIARWDVIKYANVIVHLQFSQRNSPRASNAFVHLSEFGRNSVKTTEQMKSAIFDFSVAGSPSEWPSRRQTFAKLINCRRWLKWASPPYLYKAPYKLIQFIR